MPYVVNHRLVLWHPPKTGGHWAVYALEAAGAKVEWHHPQHATPAHMPLSFAPPEAVHALLVREPWGWHWSLWHYLRVQDASDPLLQELQPSPEELGDFGLWCLRRAGLWKDWLKRYRPACPHLVLRTETLRDDLVCVVKTLLPAVDVTKLRDHPLANVGPGGIPPNWPDLQRLVEQSEISF